jgi:Flp pilus assembly protein TadB
LENRTKKIEHETNQKKMKRYTTWRKRERTKKGKQKQKKRKDTQRGEKGKKKQEKQRKKKRTQKIGKPKQKNERKKKENARLILGDRNARAGHEQPVPNASIVRRVSFFFLRLFCFVGVSFCSVLFSSLVECFLFHHSRVSLALSFSV